MNVSLTREQAKAVLDAANGDSFDYPQLREVLDKLAAALRIEERRTTEDNARERVGKCTLGIRQASVLRYVGIYPRHATVKHIAPALSLHHTQVFLILRHLQEKGLVRERKWAEWMPREKGRPRKYYELTPAGRVVLAGIPRAPAPKQECASQSEGNWVEWMQANA